MHAVVAVCFIVMLEESKENSYRAAGPEQASYEMHCTGSDIICSFHSEECHLGPCREPERCNHSQLSAYNSQSIFFRTRTSALPVVLSKKFASTTSNSPSRQDKSQKLEGSNIGCDSSLAFLA